MSQEGLEEEEAFTGVSLSPPLSDLSPAPFRLGRRLITPQFCRDRENLINTVLDFLEY